MTHITMEHHHWNPEFSHETWVDFPVRYVTNYHKITIIYPMEIPLKYHQKSHDVKLPEGVLMVSDGASTLRLWRSCSLQVVALCPPSDAATSGSTSRCLDASTGDQHRNSGFFRSYIYIYIYILRIIKICSLELSNMYIICVYIYILYSKLQQYIIWYNEIW